VKASSLRVEVVDVDIGTWFVSFEAWTSTQMLSLRLIALAT